MTREKNDHRIAEAIHAMTRKEHGSPQTTADCPSDEPLDVSIDQKKIFVIIFRVGNRNFSRKQGILQARKIAHEPSLTERDARAQFLQIGSRESFNRYSKPYPHNGHLVLGI